MKMEDNLKELENLNEEGILSLIDAVMSLVMVYGPIYVDDLVRKVDEYFPDLYNSVHEDILYGMVYALANNDAYEIDEEDRASIYDKRQMKEVLKIDEIKAIYDSTLEKTFDDPNEMLLYRNINSMDGDPYYDQLKKFIRDKKIKKGYMNKEDALVDCVAVAFTLADAKELAKSLKKVNKVSFDEDELVNLVEEFGANIPRGYLHGFSIAEMGSILAEGVDYFQQYQQSRIIKKKNVKESVNYTYQECVELAKKVKKTKIFQRFCSDNVMALLVNGEEVFIQLLGYYKGDKNIIIYGDYDNLLYNYQFMIAPEGDYVDIVNRINFTEVLLDDPEGFMDDKIKQEIDRNHYPDIPLIMDVKRSGFISLADKEKLNLVGSVLVQLLELDKHLDVSIGERCVEGDLNQVIQFYNYADGSLDIGDYIDFDLGDTIVPFDVNREIKRKRKGKHPIHLGIGMYAIGTDYHGTTYLTFLVDMESEFILYPFLRKEEDMGNILVEIVDFLEENDLKPESLTINNDFCMDVVDSLIDDYDLDEAYEIEGELLNNIFLMFQEHSLQLTDNQSQNLLN